MMKKKILILIAFIVLFLPFSVFAETRAYRGITPQIISPNAWKKVELNVENYDTLNEFDNYRFTASKTGYYLICAATLYASPQPDRYYIAGIYKNGAGVAEGRAHASMVNGVSAVVSDIIYLAAGEYLELYTFHNADQDETIHNHTTATFIAINNFYSMPDIYTLIQNATTDAEFYINKSLSYGDILILIFLTIFVFWGISHFIFTYYFKRK